MNLAQAFERFCEDYSRRTGLEVHSSISIRQSSLPTGVETTCYRVLQEAMTNISRHAKAENVRVRLEQTSNTIELEIQDDGGGFDPQKETSSTGVGLTGIRERVDLMDGTSTIESEPGKGTRLLITLPLDGEDK